MTLGTIILIVLGIAVLVFLIFGFSTGWTNLWDRVTAFSGKSNIDTIKQACVLACAGNSQAAFCTDIMTVKYGDTVESWKVEGSGADSKFVLDKVKTSSATCNQLAKNEKQTVTIGEVADAQEKILSKYPGVNIESCSRITCSAA